MKKLLIVVVVFIVAYLLSVTVISFISTQPELGVTDNKLLRCPNTPNCIGSFEDPEDTEHYMPALVSHYGAENPKEKLKQVIAEMSGTEIISEKANYIHVTYTTTMMRFIDDVEFLILEDGTVHFRSASRLGSSDFGANRRRMEEFTLLWE